MAAFVAIAVAVAAVGLWSASRSDVIITASDAPVLTEPPAFTAVSDGMAGQCQPETPSPPVTDDVPPVTLPPCPAQGDGTSAPLPSCSDPTLDPDSPQTTLAPWLCDATSGPQTTLAPPGEALPPEMTNCVDGPMTTAADDLNRPTTTVVSCQQLAARQWAEYCQIVTGVAMVGSTDVADTRERYATLLSLATTLAPPEHHELWQLLSALEANEFSYDNFNPAADELDGQWPDIEGMCPEIGFVVLGDDGLLTVLQ